MVTGVSGFEGLTGDEWQDLCVRILHQHHGAGNLLEVPDDDRGDAGLEAFSLDGHAYQCYAPRYEPLTAAQRLRKQRDKLNEDVTKFINNDEKLKSLIPSGLLIERYILLVPLITSKELHVLAATLTDVVRASSLPYAAVGICVVPLTLRAFEAAKIAVISRQLSKLRLPGVENLDYSHIDDPLIDLMNEKLSKTTRFSDLERRSVLVQRLLQNHVAGGEHRAFVSSEYSELDDDLSARLHDLEARLEVQYPLAAPSSDGLLTTVLADTEETVTKVLNTRDEQSRVIAEGQVADWLMRCPLDFT